MGVDFGVVIIELYTHSGASVAFATSTMKPDQGRWNQLPLVIMAPGTETEKFLLQNKIIFFQQCGRQNEHSWVLPTTGILLQINKQTCLDLPSACGVRNFEVKRGSMPGREL